MHALNDLKGIFGYGFWRYGGYISYILLYKMNILNILPYQLILLQNPYLEMVLEFPQIPQPLGFVARLLESRLCYTSGGDDLCERIGSKETLAGTGHCGASVYFCGRGLDDISTAGFFFQQMSRNWVIYYC